MKLFQLDDGSCINDRGDRIEELNDLENVKIIKTRANITVRFPKNLRGAKIIAYRYASGTTTLVTVEGHDGYAERRAIDDFRGFCAGAKRWA